MQSARPKKLIGVLGTHTEVGKTWVTTRLLALLRARGLRVAARKPVQSFDSNDQATDAFQLATATDEDADKVCPPHRHYPLALAPPMAADLLHRPRIALAELTTEIVWPVNVDVGVVETVGGPRSPLAHDGDSIDLLLQLRPDAVLLVADAGLGALNAVRLSLTCVGSTVGSIRTLVVLNRYDSANELHRMNRDWLQERYGVAATTDIEALTALIQRL
ncbi:MAG: dethiobiotin synthase [Candidatus Obscuribacterales bacterium]|nr:dethiobiotin synthase [Steroidobacteraceae bacterium]